MHVGLAINTHTVQGVGAIVGGKAVSDAIELEWRARDAVGNATHNGTQVGRVGQRLQQQQQQQQYQQQQYQQQQYQQQYQQQQ
jgi:hypothetical protein